jgi:hypothetical protein
MRRILVVSALLLLPVLPVAASASPSLDVQVQVHGGVGFDGPARVDLYASRPGWVSAWVVYSDGNAAPLFPGVGIRRVHPRRTYSVTVPVPCGVRIETVQVVGSPWRFDPGQCRLGYGYGHQHGSYLSVYTVSTVPMFTWTWSVGGWCTTSHRYAVVRTAHREPYRVGTLSGVKWKGGTGSGYDTGYGYRSEYEHAARGGQHSAQRTRSGVKSKQQKTKHVATGGNVAANPGRWTSGGTAKAKKVKATPGTKSSRS